MALPALVEQCSDSFHFFCSRVSWEEPLKFELKNGLTLHTVTPPGSGAIVGGILKLMDSFNISKNTEFQNTYQFIEASKFAFAQRSKLGDWNDPEILDSVKDTIKNIQSNNWTQWVLNRWNENLTVNNTQFYGANFQYVMEDHGTSHVSILAPNGDAVSVTSTVNTWFGSGTVNNKKTRTPCFSTLRFSRISPEPLDLQKIYLHSFISIFEELSAGTRIFQI